MQNLGDEIRAQGVGKAYSSLANKAQFTEPEFRRDLTGYYPDLRTYATLDNFDVQPLHASDNGRERSAQDALVDCRWAIDNHARSARREERRRLAAWSGQSKAACCSASGDSRELSALGCNLPHGGRRLGSAGC